MPGPISLTTISFRSWSCPLGSPVHGELVFTLPRAFEIVLRNVAAKRDHRFVQEFEDSYFETERAITRSVLQPRSTDACANRQPYLAATLPRTISNARGSINTNSPCTRHCCPFFGVVIESLVIHIEKTLYW